MSKTEKAPAKKTAPKKAAKKEKPTFELAKIDVNKLPEFQGWKTKLQKIDKDNPVITEIEDFKTYEEAKKRRHNRRQGRYEVQNSDKAIAAEISKIRKQAGALASELIEIVKPGEDQQHEVIQAYEDKKAAEAEAKRLEEENRQNEIKAEISSIFDDFEEGLESAKFEDLDQYNKTFLELEEADREPFDDFEWLYLDRLDAARLKLQRTADRLEEAEAARKESARLQLQNERLKQLAPVNHFGEPADLDKLWAITENVFNELLADKRQKAQASILEEAKIKAEEKERREAEAKKQAAQEAELQELRQMKAKADAEKLEAQRLAEAKEKAEKEKAEAQAHEAEDKKRKAAEAKRLKALAPVKDQLKTWAGSLEFAEETPDFKSAEAKRLAEWLQETVKNLKADFINDVNDLK